MRLILTAAVIAAIPLTVLAQDDDPIHQAIEARHGFNRMTLGLFIADLVKQTLLGLLIGAPVILAVLPRLLATLRDQQLNPVTLNDAIT